METMTPSRTNLFMFLGSKNRSIPSSDLLIFQGNTDSLVAQVVKNLSAMWETQVQSLGQEDPLEKDMGTPSSILAWRIPWTEVPGWRLQSLGFQRVRHD